MYFVGADDQDGTGCVEVHATEVDALRSALANTGEAGGITYAAPRVAFVPFGKSISDALKAAL
jgi:hypothetical protein